MDPFYVDPPSQPIFHFEIDDNIFSDDDEDQSAKEEMPDSPIDLTSSEPAPPRRNLFEGIELSQCEKQKTSY
jgi:hypothetical protein